jgi:diaminohydroxyphosphoribosylaminopyrimidine deaminase / 5-amino-6-(5-phosphoribosylamino)uracil reductase
MISFIEAAQGIPAPGPTAREVPLTDSSINMATSLTTHDREYLRRALELAEGGRGKVSPNPLVGAVVVGDGEVIGEGFHAELGDLHAERAALADCRKRGEDPAGATMYVTLEPCAHQGRQPPCAEAILEAGIGRIVIGSDDPSEKAAGRGPGILRDGGVAVEFATDEEATAARLLNQPFRKHARTGLPLVTLKLAMSLDGQTETGLAESPWISSAESQQLVHRWRAESDAIAVGIGTVLADDPLLTARPAWLSFWSHSGSNLNHAAVRQPVRVVFDRQARLPLDSRLLQTLDQSPVLVIVSQAADAARLDALRNAGAEIAVADSIEAALSELGRRGITSLFLEGGRTLASAFLAVDAIDESRTFIAPVLLGGWVSRRGGTDASRAGGGVGGTTPEQALATGGGGGSPAPTGPARRSALSQTVEQIGDDVLITTRFKEW